jgi:UDP-3-O-[3-hydroxymyristoyl] glucosamine N-acyltransferase
MVTIEQLGAHFPEVKIIGPKSRTIERLVELKSYKGLNNELSWSNDKNLAKLLSFDAGVFICSEKIREFSLKDNVTYILVKEPRKLFQKVLVQYFYTPPALGQIENTVQIHRKAKVGKNVSIGHNTVIEAGSEIGENTFIGSNNVILKNTKIGNNVNIGNNNTIGGIGFGYEKDEKGQFQLIPHIGNVVISDMVEIGNNTCIDRAVLGSTFIGENCKIDNQVHIAHNVEIGANSVIIAHAMIGGSTVIEEDTWIAPSSALINGIRIAKGSVVGLGAVVVKSVQEASVMVGNPAKPLTKASKQ